MRPPCHCRSGLVGPVVALKDCVYEHNAVFRLYHTVPVPRSWAAPPGPVDSQVCEAAELGLIGTRGPEVDEVQHVQGRWVRQFCQMFPMPHCVLRA